MSAPTTMRMFPLGTVLFPSMALPLHVFEPRYLQMIGECEAAEEPFGVVLIERGFEVGGGDQRFSVGTRARILDTAELDDGRMALIAVGTERFRVDEWLDEDPYPQATVTSIDRAPAIDPVPIDDLDRLLRRLFGLLSEAGVDVGKIEYELSEESTRALDQLCALAPLGSLDRQRLLEAPAIEEQATMLTAMLSETIELVQSQLGGA